MDLNRNATPSESMDLDLLTQTWCNSAIQLFQPMIKGDPVEALGNNNGSGLQNRSFAVDDGEQSSIAQWKLEDVKTWIWLQKTIHPELDYDICFTKKWFNRMISPLKGISISKWVKELKQKRKEEQRLHNAVVHAAISVAEVAAALAAIAAENAELESTNAMKESAVASAAALVAAQCAKVAEAMGAKHDQLNSAITRAMTVKDPTNIITLTAAAATSLRGAATLRNRVVCKEKIKSSTTTLPYNEYDFGKCRESLAKGEQLLVENPVGIVYRMEENLHEERIEEPNSDHSLKMATNNGKIKLLFNNCSQYKRWTMTINQMLILSITLSNYQHT